MARNRSRLGPRLWLGGIWSEPRLGMLHAIRLWVIHDLSSDSRGKVMVRARFCAWTKARSMITGTLSMKCSSIGTRTLATANTDMPANAAMPVNTDMPMLRTSCETEMHIWNMVES